MSVDERPKMNPEIKARWLAALRSGEYKQANGYLHIEAVPRDDVETTYDRYNGYCCLGVLCEIAVADGVIQKQRVGENDHFEYGNPEVNDWDYSVLPYSVREWAGLEDTNPYVNDLDDDEPESGDGYWIPVSEPNDNGASFEHIANLIERSL